MNFGSDAIRLNFAVNFMLAFSMWIIVKSQSVLHPSKNPYFVFTAVIKMHFGHVFFQIEPKTFICYYLFQLGAKTCLFPT
jgi:hypothetical protein